MQYPYVPTIPDGATWYSLAVVLHRFTGARNKLRTHRNLYGKQRFGPGRSNPDDMVPKPFYATYARECGLVFRPIRSLSELYLSMVGAADYAHLTYDSKPLAWCPHCVEEDINSQGWAAWRVMHQVYFLHDCPQHGARLFTRCLSCGQIKDDGTKWLLPSNTCEVCGDSNFGGHEVRPSEGYAALLRNVRAFSNARTAPFNQELWDANKRILLMRMWDHPDLEGELRQKMRARWGDLSIEQIPVELNSQEHCRWFERSFDSNLPTSPLARLLMYDVLIGAGLWGA